MGLLPYISYAAALAAFAFVTMSLASGLLYISELIEEHSTVAKYYGQRAIYAVILLHIALYFSDSLPLTHIAFSVVCHIVYLQNFSQFWPLISLSSPSFLASCVLVILDHFIWFFHFSNKAQDARHRLRGAHRHQNPTSLPQPHGFAEIASFFAFCVWIVPIFLFLSLSANDNALPTSIAVTPRTQPVSLFRSLFSSGPGRWFGKSVVTRRNSQEGFLAPLSPVISVPGMVPSLPPPLSPSVQSSMAPTTHALPAPASPRSSGNQVREYNTFIATPPEEVRLDTPPKSDGPLFRRTPIKPGGNNTSHRER